MKMLLTAIALTIAVPAVAQTADPHAGHAVPTQTGQAGHQGHDGDADHKDCCAKMAANGKQMECCEKAKEGAMDCCEKHAKPKGAADAHAGHDMSKH